MFVGEVTPVRSSFWYKCRACARRGLGTRRQHRGPDLLPGLRPPYPAEHQGSAAVQVDLLEAGTASPPTSSPFQKA